MGDDVGVIVGNVVAVGSGTVCAVGLRVAIGEAGRTMVGDETGVAVGTGAQATHTPTIANRKTRDTDDFVIGTRIRFSP